MENREFHKVAIIGAGVAGMSCALYLGRAGIDTCLIGDWVTTPLLNTPAIENYPGVKSISGYEYLENLHKQVVDAGVRVVPSVATTPLIKNESWVIITGDGTVVDTDHIVIATGSEPRMLGIENEEEFIGHGVSTCAYCDAQLYENKRVAVIGSGTLAFDEAIYLSKICAKVSIICRKDKLNSLNYDTDALINYPNISVNLGMKVVSLSRGEDGSIMIIAEGVRRTMMSFDGVFYAIGSVPNTAFLEGVFPLNKDKYIDIPEEVSSSHRMYVCGDVNANNKFKQVVTAAADGCNTAMRIIRDIKLN